MEPVAMKKLYKVFYSDTHEKYSADEFFEIMKKIPKNSPSIYAWNTEFEIFAEQWYCKVSTSFKNEITKTLIEYKDTELTIEKCPQRIYNK